MTGVCSLRVPAPAAAATRQRERGATALRAAARLPSRPRCARLAVRAQQAAPFRPDVESTLNGATSTAMAPPGTPAGSREGQKIRVALLGSGWAAASFIKNADPEAFGKGGKYELIVISPRNYFLFTPLLPAAAGGAVELRSIVEPIRAVLEGKGRYYEASCLSIDAGRRELTCEKVCAARKHIGADHDHMFKVQYDILLVGVGATNATFGIPGVAEHCWFMKTVDDARKLRMHLSKSIEHAGLPETSSPELRKLLRVVVVGGGPTGVEGKFSITLIAVEDNVLAVYSQPTSEYATRHLASEGIELMLGSLVQAVGEEALTVKTRDGEVVQVPYGTCVWAAGIAPHPLVAELRAQLPAEEQAARRGLLVNQYLQVAGSGGSIFALGDAAATAPSGKEQLPATAQVARQQAEYLAAMFNKHTLRPAPACLPDVHASVQDHASVDLVQDLRLTLPKEVKPFRRVRIERSMDRDDDWTAGDVQHVLDVFGWVMGHVWRGMETGMQFSLRNMLMVASDWVRVKLFGRNFSDV
eukprot:scaffold2.g6921.t1